MAWSLCQHHPANITQPPSAVLPAPRWSFPRLWPYHLGFWQQDPRLDWFCSGFLGGRSLPKNQGSIVGKWRNLSVCQWFTCWLFLLFTVLLVILLAVLVVFYFCIVWPIWFVLLHLYSWLLVSTTSFTSQLPRNGFIPPRNILQQKQIQVPWGLKGMGTLKLQMQ